MTDDKKQPIALEERAREAARMFSPSAARNRDVIREAFLKTMPRSGVILEVGSGTGEHCVHLAAAAPALRFFPGDPDEASRASIAGWAAHHGLSNVAAPHGVDVSARGWHEAFHPVDGIVSINMIHIAPFAAAEGLFEGAGRLLKGGGRLFLYGPFSRDGAHIAASNAAFDKSLKSRNPSWGVRDLEREITPLAEKAGLSLTAVIDMPANNFSVIFEKA
ncbi:MAG: DUF938 domain-containing protein [Parvularculaceae bacterium]